MMIVIVMMKCEGVYQMLNKKTKTKTKMICSDVVYRKIEYDRLFCFFYLLNSGKIEHKNSICIEYYTSNHKTNK
jgi:hypothetical protein